MQDHPYGWLSLLPPLVAIVLAIVTKRVVISLLVGIFVGAGVLQHWHPVETVICAVKDQLWPALIDSDKLHVFAFTLLLGALIGVINRSGGMRGLVETVAPLAKTRRRGQFTVWLLGLFVFFDDYANTLLLGKTLQPLTDRLKISREKLAYLVDSTAAPVAGLALISTWVAIEIDYINNGLAQVGGAPNTTGAALFLGSIPYRFYVWGALLFVPLVALSGRDFGPMRKAEQRTVNGQLSGPKGTAASEPEDLTAPDPETPARWLNAVLPVIVTVVAVIYFLYQSGLDPDRPEQTLQEVIGNANSYTALLWGALTGVLFAALLVAVQLIIPLRDIGSAAWQGALKMTPALVILWLAGALSGITGLGANGEDSDAETEKGIKAAVHQEWADWLVLQQKPEEWDEATVVQTTQSLVDREVDPATIATALASADVDKVMITQAMQQLDLAVEPADEYPYRSYRLYTGPFLNQKMSEQLPVWLLPTVVFVLAGFIAFSTGTSWGTMALVMPLAIPLAAGALPDGVDGSQPLLLAVVGSVLAGAIFGDHCSPISDTTVLSSQSSGCDHIAHVRTQMPYALAVGLIVILLGTVPVGLGLSVWLCLPLQLAALVACLFLFGKTTEDENDSTAD